LDDMPLEVPRISLTGLC